MLHVNNDNDNDDDDNVDNDVNNDSDDNDDNDLLEHLSSNKLYCYDFNSVEKKNF